mmetsp:Transcript_30126/g.61147  ORF Transcript_30126/g.61147 Transcript_30126/m.61147 type:complete len:201 (-) Transcript_30126:1216-1818(-)
MNHDISATMGIEFDTQMLDTEHGKVKAQIWDTAGQERFARVLLPTYFRKAKGVILVYDITNAKSFESLSERWMTQLNDHASSDDLAKLLVGNKSDLDASREVPTDKAEQFCIEHGMEMLETSAKSGDNVLRAFEKLIGIVHERALTQQKARGGLKGLGQSGAAGGVGGGGQAGGAGAGGFKIGGEDAPPSGGADASACGC